MDKAQQWGIRIAHEATEHAENSFLTLTYDDEHLPEDYSISVRETQLFIKRLRKSLEPKQIRFYICGEYGDQNGRPHYHAIIFGHDFPDKTLWRKTPSGMYTYRSPSLEKLWTFGHSEIGTVTRQSGAYVARYMLKKISGPPAGSHYQRLHPVTGQICDVQPEFSHMSTRPGLGYRWIDKYEGDAFPSGYLVDNGQKTLVPQYYKNRLRGRNPDPFWGTDDYYRNGEKGRRHRHEPEQIANSTPERLASREESAFIRADKLKREV